MPFLPPRFLADFDPELPLIGKVIKAVGEEVLSERIKELEKKHPFLTVKSLSTPWTVAYQVNSFTQKVGEYEGFIVINPYGVAEPKKVLYKNLVEVKKILSDYQVTYVGLNRTER